MTNEEGEKLRKELEMLMGKYGVVDYYYGGVDLIQQDIQGFCYGCDGRSNSNRTRKLYLMGLMTEHLFDVNYQSEIQGSRKSDEEL